MLLILSMIRDYHLTKDGEQCTYAEYPDKLLFLGMKKRQMPENTQRTEYCLHALDGKRRSIDITYSWLTATLKTLVDGYSTCSYLVLGNEDSFRTLLCILRRQYFLITAMRRKTNMLWQIRIEEEKKYYR